MRLLHTADVHIGRRYVSLGEEKGRAQREQLLETFERVCGLAAQEGVDAMLVAGDLFDGQAVSPTAVVRVRKCVEGLDRAGVHTVLMPGTHDPYEPGGVWDRLELPHRAHLLTPERPSVRIDVLDLAVHGVLGGGKRLRDGLAALKADKAVGVNVAMVHGSLPLPGLTDASGEEPLDMEALAWSGMDYVALGHWHSSAVHRARDVTMAYPGSPEAVDFDQRKAGNVLMVELSEGGHGAVEPRVREVPVGRRRLEVLELDAWQLGTEEGIAAAVEERAHPDLGLEVRLVGIRPAGLSLDPDQLASDLGAGFFRLKVVDRTHPSLDAVDPDAYPEATVIGRFVRDTAAQAEGADEATRDEIAEALAIGVALLEGKELPL